MKKRDKKKKVKGKTKRATVVFPKALLKPVAAFLKSNLKKRF